MDNKKPVFIIAILLLIAGLADIKYKGLFYRSVTGWPTKTRRPVAMLALARPVRRKTPTSRIKEVGKF